MAFPANLSSSVISDIIATTIQQRSGALADNVTNNNALLMTLKKRGNIRPFSGGDSILEEIMYNDATTINAQSYSGYEPVNITVNSPISAAQFQIKQYAASVSMSGLEMLQNAGKEKIIDLLDGRMKVAEAQLQNLITNDLFLDGTGNGGRAITGLDAALPITTNANIYGGIDRNVWAFWRPVSFRGVTDGGAAVSSANIQSYMNRIAVQLVRGTDRPDCIFADNNYYRTYLESLQAIQRVTDDGNSMQGAGFASLKYYGAGFSSDVVLVGGLGVSATANTMWFVNTNYLYFRPHASRNFVPIGGERQSVNQDAVVKLMGWAGNLTSSGPQFSGRLSA
jgi:hypothetical protein